MPIDLLSVYSSLLMTWAVAFGSVASSLPNLPQILLQLSQMSLNDSDHLGKFHSSENALAVKWIRFQKEVCMIGVLLIVLQFLLNLVQRHGSWETYQTVFQFQNAWHNLEYYKLRLKSHCKQMILGKEHSSWKLSNRIWSNGYTTRTVHPTKMNPSMSLGLGHCWCRGATFSS